MNFASRRAALMRREVCFSNQQEKRGPTTKTESAKKQGLFGWQKRRENMIRITVIDREHRQDIRLPNEPFAMTGRIVPSYVNEQWSYEVRPFPPERVGEMCFPDENYDYDEMKDSVFLGAYEDEKCVGLAVLQPGFFRYLYLYDLKVCRAYRGQKIGALLIDKAREIALRQGYRGLYTQGQDNNVGACLFYLHYGFHIGGLDTEVYRGTRQEGKADILFYLDA